MTKVTIGITTYNLEKYIGQCLDSILSQKTNFDYKILVVDDASTDGTKEILQSYKDNNPDKVDVIFKEKNGGSLESSNILFNNIKTEYFSFIDGDDYWLTETRLQEAIDFLDNHKDYTMYGANTIYLRDNKLDTKVIGDKYLDKTYCLDDYVNRKSPFVHTSSIILRNVVYNNGMPQEYIDNEKTIYNCVFRGEDIRFIEHLHKGKLYVSSKDYSVYRIHEAGLWQGSSENKRILEGCISMIKYPERFPALEKYCAIGFYKNFNKFLEHIADNYNLNEKEHKLFVGILEGLNQKAYLKYVNAINPDKKILLKNRIRLYFYNKLKSKLEKWGLV